MPNHYNDEEYRASGAGRLYISPKNKRKRNKLNEQPASDETYLDEGNPIGDELSQDGRPLESSNSEIWSDITRQGQLRDSLRNKDFDKDVEAARGLTGRAKAKALIDAGRKAGKTKQPDLFEINKETGWPEVWLGNFQRFFEAIAPDFSDPKEVTEFYTDLKVGHEGYKFGALAGALAADYLPFPPAVTVTSSGTLGSVSALALNRNQRDIIGDFVRNAIGKTGSGSDGNRPKIGNIVRPDSIDTKGLSLKQISDRFNKVAKELGYEVPDIPTILSQTKSGIPADIQTIYIAHEKAFYKHIQKLKDADPSLKLDLRVFPDFIHEGKVFRPRVRTKGGVPTAWGVQEATSRVKDHQVGKSARVGRLKELNKQTGYTAKDFAAQKPKVLEKWNELIRARGGKELQLGDIHLDHRDPVKLTEAYGKNLSSKNKNIVYNEIKRAGGLLGDDPLNAEGLTAAINISKQSRLDTALKNLNHKSAASFGKDQTARVNYYRTPLKSGLTPIQEYIREVDKVNEWAMDEMIKIVNLAPVIKPGKLRELSKKQYNLLLEIFDGEENVTALAERLYTWAREEGLTEFQLKQFFVEEIELKLSGKYPYK